MFVKSRHMSDSFSAEHNPNDSEVNVEFEGRTIIIVLVGKAILFYVLPLVMGVVYQSQCKVQEMIPRFLMILGIKGIGENFLICILMFILLFILRQRSELDRRKIFDRFKLIAYSICIISNIAWVIAGCVWTFGVKNRVQFDDVENVNYCHPTLYQYAFVWCILWLIYIFMAFVICIPCIRILQWKLTDIWKELNPVQHNLKL